MNEFTRVAVASRAFSLAAIVGLAIAFGRTAALGPTMVVVTTAAIASYLAYTSAEPTHWVMSVEAAVAGLVVVSALPESVVLLPYLVVLPLLAGLARGVFGASLVIVAQLTVIVGGSLVSRAGSTARPSCSHPGPSPSSERGFSAPGARSSASLPRAREPPRSTTRRDDF